MGIEFKKVQKLIDEKDICKFNIPDYQRGYRWEKTQVTELLDDLLDFFKKEKKEAAEIYCMQPLVVAKNKDEDNLYDVVDGQQRLTTVFLILKSLNADSDDSECYSIQYQSRIDSKKFLENIQNANRDSSKKYSDYYYMYNAYSAINKWIETKLTDTGESDKYSKKDYKKYLLNRVEFVYYDIENENAMEVFTRLNVGKISLTSSELIKALFLNRSNYGSSIDEKTLKIVQGRIALKWDDMEYALQRDEFWYFIHGIEYNKPTRMEYILDLVYEFKSLQNLNEDFKKYVENKEKLNKGETVYGDDDYTVFRYFNDYFKYCSSIELVDIDWIEELWNTIKEYYMVFVEWYNDFELYHHIGYLLALEKDEASEKKLIKDLLEQRKKSVSKSEFKEAITQKVRNSIKKKWIHDVRTTVFNSDEEGTQKISMKECYNVLLLHNIYTVIRQNIKMIEDSKYKLPDSTRFPFHLFKKQCGQSRKWEIEHIRPNSGSAFKSNNDKMVYLGMSAKILEQEYPDINNPGYTNPNGVVDIYTSIRKLMNEKEIQDDNEKFGEVTEYLVNLGDNSLDDDQRNMLWNYVLLDGITNTQYGNKIFPIKRIFIRMKEMGEKPEEIKWDPIKNELEVSGKKESAFIPPCVRNVFTKYYSDTPTTMMNWTETDAKAYLDDIIKMLEHYGIMQN